MTFGIFDVKTDAMYLKISKAAVAEIPVYCNDALWCLDHPWPLLKIVWGNDNLNILCNFSILCSTEK